jgi:hypothetical protein
VSLLAAVNDVEKRVAIVIDEALLKSNQLSSADKHPNNVVVEIRYRNFSFGYGTQSSIYFYILTQRQRFGWDRGSARHLIIEHVIVAPSLRETSGIIVDTLPCVVLRARLYEKSIFHNVRPLRDTRSIVLHE